ncbi:MAG: minor extracellular serine protease Vpr [Gaiellaceae bacterium]|nr:minor extracellular serine protease Vpr [Gaiellaceae bacterium]
MARLQRPGLLILALVTALGLAAATGSAAPSRPDGRLVEVVVTLPRAPLTVAAARNARLGAAVTRGHSVDVRAGAAVSYLRTLSASQAQFTARLATDVPEARVNWHYGVALDGVSVVVPASQLSRLKAIPGATVWPTATYHSLGSPSPTAVQTGADNRPPQLLGAIDVWGPELANAGQGVKIGIIDDGILQTHPYFDPTGFSYPAGYPLGNTDYTTPKVIVARAFAPPSTTWKYADTPFDPQYSDHGTHVAGIAAGNYDTPSIPAYGHISGIAPKAYLGNYKALTVPTFDFGLDGNSPEIAKAIDQAVADGMNVINLSIGEPEVAPKRDLVVQALDNAADAGVVSVVAAGNDYQAAGLGSIGSPANAPRAITVAAATGGNFNGPADVITGYSAGGPAPISFRPKPDVAAPGVSVLSSIPGGWQPWDGTSMASPEVAGAAALLMQSHPTWTVRQVKSALMSTGVPATIGGHEASTLREGGGRIYIPTANNPLLFTRPSTLGWGLVRRGFTTTTELRTKDAGGGAAPWTVSIAPQSMPAGATLESLSPTLIAGEPLLLRLTISADASAGDATGFVVLARDSDVRRVPFWFHVEIPKLQLDPHQSLYRPGIYHGDTTGGPKRVSTYRYPERGEAPGVPTSLAGPEQVFRFRLRKAVANFGIVIRHVGAGARVSPRLVRNDDENQLDGYTGLPATLNPYGNYGNPAPVVGAVLPGLGIYDFVFDTPTGKRPGAFRFRFWVDDTTPPTVTLLTRKVAKGDPIRLALHDAGAGVDPGSIVVKYHGVEVPALYKHGKLFVSTVAVARGRFRLIVSAADYQELKNMEDVVGPALPNTRVFSALVTVS